MFTPHYQGNASNNPLGMGHSGHASGLDSLGNQVGLGLSSADYNRLVRANHAAAGQVNVQPIVGLPYDALLRIEALKAAHDPNMAADGVTRRAESYLKFLQGG